MTSRRFTPAWLAEHRVSISPVLEADVVGIGHVLTEIRSLVARLRNPDQAARMGAELPRGIVLHGQAGTGKTLVGRLIASLLGSEVPFYELSSDELTPDRVRGTIRHLAAIGGRSVVFIDEIDQFALDRRDESHTPQTRAVLVSFLAALDGLIPSAGPILVGATTRSPESLDDALLRAGRLGVRVRFTLPDAAERRLLLQLFARGKAVAEPIDWDHAAQLSALFTPADLRQVVDDALGLAMADGRDSMSDTDLVAAVHRAGAVEPEPVGEGLDLARTAIHEAGHAVVAHGLGVGLVRVRLDPTGDGSTLLDESELRFASLPLPTLRAHLAVGFGGFAAEKILLGDASLGIESDVRRATGFATRLAEAGLLEFGPVALDTFGFAVSADLADRRGAAIARELDRARNVAMHVITLNVEAVRQFAVILRSTDDLAGEPLARALLECRIPNELAGLVDPASWNTFGSTTGSATDQASANP